MKLKRFFGLVLAVCMIFGIMPVSIHAKEKEIEIRTIEEFVEYLSQDGDVDIKVMENMIYTTTAEQAGMYWVTLGSGSKTIDLNGCSVELNAETGKETTMLRIPEGANLIINDSSGDHSGKLFCYGKIESPGDYGLYYQNHDVKFRNVVEVSGGELTVNGGMLEAGRSKKIWIYDGCDITDWHWQLGATMIGGALGKALGCRFDGYAYQQINGDCITLNGGKVTIRDGVFFGRGYSQLESYISGDVRFEVKGEKAAVIRAAKGTLHIYDGEFYARGNADVFALPYKAFSGGDVNGIIREGVFRTQYLKIINVPSYTTAITNANHPMIMGKSKGATDDIMKFQPKLAHVGDINLPIDALDARNHTVEIEGEVIPVSEWSPYTLQDTSSDVGGITLSLTYTAEKDHGTEDKRIQIASTEIFGTVAKGMLLTNEVLTCDTKGIRKMIVEWYCNGVPVEANSEVFVGDYQARVTLVADTGYKFTGSSELELMGDKPVFRSIAASGRSAEIWSTYHSFACDHSLNEDDSILFDEQNHYQQCTVCGDKIIEETHCFGQGTYENGMMKYDCGVCGYYIERYDNGKIKTEFIQLTLSDPVVGEKPKYDAKVVLGEGVRVSAVNADYTSNGVTWTKAATGWEVDKEDLFVGDFRYKAIVQLELDEEYSLSEHINGEYDTEIYVNGTPATYEVTEEGVKVYYEYITEDVFITNVDIYGIDYPEVGKKPDYAVQSVAPQYYDINYVWWYDGNGNLMDRTYGKFEEDQIYTIEIVVELTRCGWDEIAVFDKEAMCATVNGYTVLDGDYEWLGNTLSIRFTFIKLNSQIGIKPVDVTRVFSDIQGNAWYVSSVQYVYDNGIMSGSNGMFKPTGNITRAQVVTTLYNIEGRPAVTDYSAVKDMVDVQAGQWYTDAVCWAYSVGVANGNASTKMFNMSNPVTRQQLATFFYNYAAYKGFDTKTRGDYSSLLGADQVASYAADTMKWAYGTGLITGSATQVDGVMVYDLKPTGTATRAQMASILQRFCQANNI